MTEVPTKIVVGYADRLSVAPGETIGVMVNVDGEARYRADIVKLISGDWHPRGAGFKEELIATTANVLRGDRERCLEAGCDEYLPKPLDVRELQTMLRRYLGGPNGRS